MFHVNVLLHVVLLNFLLLDESSKFVPFATVVSNTRKGTVEILNLTNIPLEFL